MKIDIVLTWVDGNDKKWQKEKEKYLKEEDLVNNSVRFRDWDNLKYIFRGIEKFMPWINKIYFITWGHLPEWLNSENDKIEIINHKDYIPEEFLPTFNSHTIELNLHRIKNLSEHFIYFNDDTFILKPLKGTDFFKNGLPCESAILNPIICTGKDHFSNISANNLNIINEHFYKRKTIKSKIFNWYNFRYGMDMFRTLFLTPWNNFTGFYNGHLPNAYLKSTFNEIWDKEEKVLRETCMCQFRDNYKNVNQWVVKYWQLATNKFYPRSPKIGKYYELSDNNSEIVNAILNQKYKMICINDSNNITNFEKTKNEVNIAFEKVFPNKSIFEK